MEEEPQAGTTLMGEPDSGTTQWHSDEHSDLVKRTGWKDADSVLKSYKELETSYSGRVKLPTDQSSKEELEAFYRSTGRPDAPEGYVIKDVPGNVVRNEAAENVLKAVAFERGCPKDTFEAFVKTFYQGESDALIASKTENESLLKEEWSKPGQYDANIEIVKRAANEFFSEETKSMLESTGIGNFYPLVKDIHNMGLKMSDDTIIQGSPSGYNKEDKDFKPKSPNSPEMYATGDDEESIKSRKYFTDKGHVYH